VDLETATKAGPSLWLKGASLKVPNIEKKSSFDSLRLSG
jgi:hypothetical protein